VRTTGQNVGSKAHSPEVDTGDEPVLPSQFEEVHGDDDGEERSERKGDRGQEIHDQLPEITSKSSGPYT